MDESLKDIFFTDELTSVPVSYGDIETRGILDAEQQQFDGLVQSDTHTLLVPSCDFTTLPKSGDRIEVGGETWSVNVPFQRIDDGKIGRIGLQRPYDE